MSFFFTGFGQFAGVKENPSQALIQSFLKDSSCLNIEWQSDVLETSGVAVRNFFEQVLAFFFFFFFF